MGALCSVPLLSLAQPQQIRFDALRARIDHCHFRHSDQTLDYQSQALMLSLAMQDMTTLNDGQRLANLTHDLMVAYQRLDLYVVALPMSELLTVMAPDNSHYWQDHAFGLAQLGRIDESFEALRRSLALAPDDRFSLMMLGDLKLRVGEDELALPAYQRAYEKSATDADRLYALLSLYPLWRSADRASADDKLAAALDDIESHVWPRALVEVLGGQRASAGLADELFDSERVKTCAFSRNRLFETFYHAANLALANEDSQTALTLYAQAAELVPVGANRELLLLDKRLYDLGAGPPPVAIDATE
ncbi:hypothetical protein S4A8_12784 [Salinisphaera sp. S4-8]